MKLAQHTLTSLFADIENSDPRIDEFGQNAHEFTFLNFAFNDFERDPEQRTLGNIASWVEFFIECVGENVYRNCCKDGEEYSEAVQNFIELLEVFNAAWVAANFQAKTEFIEEQQRVIVKALAERDEE